MTAGTRDDGVADQWLVALDDSRDISQCGRSGVFYGDLAEVLRLDDREVVLNAEPLVRRLDEPAGARRRRLQKGQRRNP